MSKEPPVDKTDAGTAKPAREGAAAEDAEWWEFQRPAASAPEPASEDAPGVIREKPAAGLDEEALRKKARGREAHQGLLRNPMSDFDRRSGELEGLVRTRGSADDVVPERRSDSFFWPAVGIFAVLAAAAAAVGIPIYLNHVEMEKLARELAENPVPSLTRGVSVFERIDTSAPEQAPGVGAETGQSGAPSPMQQESEEQRRFAGLLEKADDASLRGDLKAIQEVVAETLDKAPDRADVLLLVAASLGTASPSLSGESKAALRKVLRPLYEQAAGASAGVPVLLQRCGDFFASNGEFDRAKELYERAAELSPADPLAAQKKAFILLEQSGPGEAIAALKGMAARQPDNPAVQANLARLLLANKQPQEALPHLEAARKADPEDPAMLLRHLRTLIDLGLWQAALDEISEVSEGLRQTPAVRFFTAQAMFRLGKRAEAMEIFRALAEMRPPGGPELAPGAFAYTYGVAAMLQGEADLAIRLFEEAVEHAPNTLPAARNNLAWLLVEHGRDPARAVDMAKKAVALEPSNGAFSDTLARALLAAGDVNGAIERSKAAISLSGDAVEGEMFETLGDALARAGKKEEAAAAYDKALSRSVPDPEKIRAKLKNL